MLGSIFSLLQLRYDLLDLMKRKNNLLKDLNKKLHELAEIDDKTIENLDSQIALKSDLIKLKNKTIENLKSQIEIGESLNAVDLKINSVEEKIKRLEAETY